MIFKFRKRIERQRESGAICFAELGGGHVFDLEQSRKIKMNFILRNAVIHFKSLKMFSHALYIYNLFK